MNTIDENRWYKTKEVARENWIQKPGVNLFSAKYNYILNLIKDGKLIAKNFGRGKIEYFGIKGSEIKRFIQDEGL